MQANFPDRQMAGQNTHREGGAASNRWKSLAFDGFCLICRRMEPTQVPAHMGQQSKKIVKRRRRADYLKRKKELAKLGGVVKRKPAAKKPVADKPAPAKKVAAKKAPAKKAPAKK
ncbi:MAG: hypothetical protein K9M97_11390, partial [Akkermansiaceae bacterium]|nr:hypothetical protein [Akkermansiaceae bacterium]